MKRSTTRLAATIIAAIALVMTVAPAAQAKKAQPIAIEKFNETFEDPFFGGFLAQECNVAEVTATVTEKGRVKIFENGATGHVNIRVVLENPATGQRIIQSFSNTFSDFDAETFRDDGLLEVHIQSSNTGLAQKWHAPGVGVIVRDAGQIEFDTVLLIDPTIEDGDPVIDVMESFTSKGPHPWAENGFGPTPEQGAAICGALGGSV